MPPPKVAKDNSDITTENVFQSLENLNETEEMEDDAASISTNKSSTKSSSALPIKIPPIFTHDVTNHREMTEKVISILDHKNFYSQFSGKYIKIQTKSIED